MLAIVTVKSRMLHHYSASVTHPEVLDSALSNQYRDIQYIHTYIHTYIHIYIHTYIHIYIYIYIYQIIDLRV